MGVGICPKTRVAGSESCCARDVNVRTILVDAGPLVALLDRSDAAHAACVAALGTLPGPLLTVWPVLAEAMYLLGEWAPQEALWCWIEDGSITLAPLGLEDVPRIRELMAKYRDRPMDLADAALVRVAERDRIRRVFTLDRSDFQVYRAHGKDRFSIVP